jgi:hypothetical protein
MSINEPTFESDAAGPMRTIHWETRMEKRGVPAKADCFDFATSFYTTMPREIRDQVYSHLYLLDPHIPLKLFKAEQHLGPPMVLTDVPHWQLHNGVGPDFAREYTELFYTNTELHFDPVETPGVFPITNILEHDSFGTEILPSDFIRSCIIDFSGREFDYSGIVDGCALKSQINSLLTLKPHPTRKVTFRIDLACDRHEHDLYDIMFKHILFLGPLLYNFKDRGLHFTVLLSTDLSEPREEWRDVTFLWDMGQTELFYKLHEWAASYGM